MYTKYFGKKEHHIKCARVYAKCSMCLLSLQLLECELYENGDFFVHRCIVGT